MDPVLPLGLDVSLRWGLVYGDRYLVVQTVGGTWWQVERLTPQIKHIFPVSALPRVQLLHAPGAAYGCMHCLHSLLCDDIGMVDVHQAAYKVEKLCVTFLDSLSRRHCMLQLATSEDLCSASSLLEGLHICGGFEQRQGTSLANIWGSPVAALHCTKDISIPVLRAFLKLMRKKKVGEAASACWGVHLAITGPRFLGSPSKTC